jgi:3-phenylpropionate/trans-cinnamate dioxygenase ferredoxin reductase subunit
MSINPPIVIIGAGHSGVQAAAALRDEGVDAPILLIGDEAHMPYERPPLSKSFVRGTADAGSIQLRDAAFFSRARIDLLLGAKVTQLDLGARRVCFSSRPPLDYSHLILATGSTNRRIACDVEMEGVHALRSLDDAIALRAALQEAESVVVIGAGFIGMEFAAAATRPGRQVTVVELASRLLGRSATPYTAEFIRGVYAARGIRFHFGAAVERLEQSAGRVTGVRLTDGQVLAAQLVLVGVGAVASDGLAKAAGLACPNGVAVNEAMQTADPSVSAIGDCSWHPNRHSGTMLRLESVQNAGDQARVCAKRISGKPAAYGEVPWFWSDLGDHRLQIAGFLNRCDRTVMRGSPGEGGYSLYGFSRGVLTGVESVNRPGDHLLARRILGARLPITPEDVADASVDLKRLLTQNPANA